MKISQKDAENNVNKRCTELNIKLLNCFIYTNVRKTRLRLLCEKDNYSSTWRGRTSQSTLEFY